MVALVSGIQAKSAERIQETPPVRAEEPISEIAIPFSGKDEAISSGWTQYSRFVQYANPLLDAIVGVVPSFGKAATEIARAGSVSSSGAVRQETSVFEKSANYNTSFGSVSGGYTPAIALAPTSDRKGSHNQRQQEEDRNVYITEFRKIDELRREVALA